MCRFGIWLAAVVALWTHAVWAAPLEAYGKLPSIESATISPSGHAVAVVVTNGEYSPLAHAAEVDIPVLLIHGRDDTVVPLEQSQLMADALQRAGKPVELVVQKGADHWLSRGDTRLTMLQAVTAFLEKNNPPN